MKKKLKSNKEQKLHNEPIKQPFAQQLRPHFENERTHNSNRVIIDDDDH